MVVRSIISGFRSMAVAPASISAGGARAYAMGAFTAEELKDMHTLKHLIEFLKIKPEVADAFYAATGSKGDTMPRVLGVLEFDELKTEVYALHVPEVADVSGEADPATVLRKLNMVERGSLMLLVKACRMIAGTDILSPGFGPSLIPLAPHPLASPPAPSTGLRKVKLSHILAQADDTECEIGPESLMAQGRGRYEATYGASRKPPADSDVTLEQLSAVDYLMKAGVVPYVDFAIWGPHGHRMTRKLRLSGQVLDAGATFRYVEVAGPPNIEVWEQSYNVMSTAFIMLNLLDLGTLEQYRRKIIAYHTRYGPSCWLLLYQADTRFRNEELERQRRDTVTNHALAVAAGRHTPYDVNRPWNQTWLDGMANGDWWKDEFQEPAQLYLTRTNKLDQFIGGDAPIGNERGTGASEMAPINRPPKRTLPPSGPVRQPKLPKQARYDKPDLPPQNNGRYSVNRRGQKLCELFQTNGCGRALADNLCPVDRTCVHQCAICLKGDHGANSCPGPQKGKGKGKKGKGKGKGKAQW